MLGIEKLGPVHIRVGMGIERPKAGDAGRLFQRHAPDRQRVVNDPDRLEEGKVVILPHEPDLFADGAPEHRRARAVATGGHRVPAIIRHVEAGQLPGNLGPRPGRVGQQNHLATPGPEGAQCLDRLGKGGHAIVDTAPKIAEHRIVSIRDIGKVFDNLHAQTFSAGMICFFRLTTPGRLTRSPSVVAPKLFSATCRTRSFGMNITASSARISTRKNRT